MLNKSSKKGKPSLFNGKKLGDMLREKKGINGKRSKKESFGNSYLRNKIGGATKRQGFEEQMKNFFEDITKCDNKQRCGRNNLLQQLSSCICQSIWSRHSDPAGRLCQAIPKDTRTKAVQVVSMFMKGKGPQMPQNKTLIREMKKLSKVWKQTFEKLTTLPFEGEDWEVCNVRYFFC